MLKFDNVAWKDVRAYGTDANAREDGLANAISKISTTETTLLISNQQDVTADATVPSTMTLRFTHGGSLNISTGKTVTINGHVEAGLYQIFEGSGTVVFGSGSVKAVYPEWWGAVAHTDSVTALNSAANSGIPAILSAMYNSSDSLIITNTHSQATLLGKAPIGRSDQLASGTPRGCGIKFTDDSEPGIEIKIASGSGFPRFYAKDLTLYGAAGSNAAHIGVSLPEASGESMNDLILEKCHIFNWGGNAVDIRGGTGPVIIRDCNIGGNGNYGIYLYSGNADVFTQDVKIIGGSIQGSMLGAISLDQVSYGSGGSIDIEKVDIELLSETATKPIIYINDVYRVSIKDITIATDATIATVTPHDAMIAIAGNTLSVTIQDILCKANGGLNNIYFGSAVRGINVIGGFYSNKTGMGAGVGYFIYNEATNLQGTVIFPVLATFTTNKDLIYDNGVTYRGLSLIGLKHGSKNSSYGYGIGTFSPSVNADLTLENGELCLKETSTPTADTNYGKIYTKNDNKLYFQDGAGTEHEVSLVAE